MNSAKDPPRGSHSTVGDKIENRERRSRERENLTFFPVSALISGKFRIKNGENLYLS